MDKQSTRPKLLSHISESTSRLHSLLEPARDVISHFEYGANHDYDSTDNNGEQFGFNLSELDDDDDSDNSDIDVVQSTSNTLPTFTDHASVEKMRELLSSVRPSVLNNWSSLNPNPYQVNMIKDMESYRNQQLSALRQCLSHIKSTSNNSSNNTVNTAPTLMLSIQVIGLILRCYEINNAAEELIEMIVKFESEDGICILDYFHVIMSIPSSSFHEVFERIQDELRDEADCDIETCHKHNRHRERQQINQSSSQRVPGHNLDLDAKDETESLYQFYRETLDMIHCNILHSYDTGMRVRDQSGSGLGNLELGLGSRSGSNSNSNQSHNSRSRLTPNSPITPSSEDREESVYSLSHPPLSPLDDLDLDQNFEVIFQKRAHSKRSSRRRQRNPITFSRIMGPAVTPKSMTMKPSPLNELSHSKSDDDHNNNDNNPNSSSSLSSVTSDHNNKYYSESRPKMTFDFGYKYYYWQHFRGNDEMEGSGPNHGYKKSDFYVMKRYENMKQEMLNNKICRLEAVQFNRAMVKAKTYLNSKIARKMKSSAVPLSEYCCIRPGTMITEENLLSVLLYSDYTLLCTKFSATFRKLEKDETVQEMTRRNGEFWNWSKLLIETVELYGTHICNSKIKVFYHGVSMMTFPSFLSHFCGPTSTTPQITVAEQFCGSAGLILELEKENDYSLLKYFDVQWISAFANEDERLFIWGDRPLRFHSIIHRALGNANYFHWITALTLFDYVLSGTKLRQSDKEKKKFCKQHGKIINYLMDHHNPYARNQTNNFPKYINDTFETFANARTKIVIQMTAIRDDYPFMKKYILSSSPKCKNLVLFDKFASLFPNCESIEVWSDLKDKENSIITKEYLHEMRVMLTHFDHLKEKSKLKCIRINDVLYKNEHRQKVKYLDQNWKALHQVIFTGYKLFIDQKHRMLKNHKRVPIGSDLIIRRNVQKQRKRIGSRANSARRMGMGRGGRMGPSHPRPSISMTDFSLQSRPSQSGISLMNPSMFEGDYLRSSRVSFRRTSDRSTLALGAGIQLANLDMEELIAQSSVASNTSVSENGRTSRKMTYDSDVFSEEEKEEPLTDYEHSPQPVLKASPRVTDVMDIWTKSSPRMKHYEKKRITFRNAVDPTLGNIDEVDTPSSVSKDISSPRVTELFDIDPNDIAGDTNQNDGDVDVNMKAVSSIRVTLLGEDENIKAANVFASVSPPVPNAVNARQSTLSPPLIQSKIHMNRPSNGTTSYHHRSFSTELLNDIKKRTLSERFNAQKMKNHLSILSLEKAENEILGITSYTAQQIWKKSALKGTRNNIAKYQDLYPNLIQQFKKWTGITQRVPTSQQLRGYFIKYSPSTNHKANIELLMHSNQFEPFYQWFQGMSLIIKDFAHIYNEEQDILNALFCSKTQAKQKLIGCEVGTFLIRIGKEQNRLYISCKLDNGQIQHFSFRRIEDEIYKYGKTQSPIFNVIRSTKQFKRFYSSQSKIVTVEKSHIF